MNEIDPDIFTWAWFSEPHGYNLNGYLVRNAEDNLCIDPVSPGDEFLANIARMSVARILLTNRNHSRAANIVRERTGARTLIHPDDAAHARSQGAVVDGDLSIGAKIGPLTIVAVPGKSPGEVALRWPERSPHRRQRGDRQSAGILRASARKSDGRSRAPAAKRAQAPRPRIRHAAFRRRDINPPRR